MISSSLSWGITHEIELDGRKITVEDVDPYRYEKVEINQDRAPNNQGKHTVRAYGSMRISFMAAVVISELAYCNLAEVAQVMAFETNDETPTCYTELKAMLLDPGMNLGVLAMTATSIELYRRGDKVLNRLFKNLTSGRKEKVLNLSRVMLQHLSMGAGMIVQTSFAASWNAPQMRKCFGVMWGSIKSAMNTNNIANVEALHASENGQEIVSGAMEEAHQKPACVEAREHFFDAESGTLSEIYITVISLGVSSVISGALITSFRFAGMALFGWNPVGLGMIAGFIIAEQIIEIIDRVLEPIIRAFYHSRRSKRQLTNAFADLTGAAKSYVETGGFIKSYTYPFCESFTPYPQGYNRSLYAYDSSNYGCQSWAQKIEYGFELSEALNKYQDRLRYRREASLNRFIESHNRWKEKMSNVITNMKAFQETAALIYELREGAPQETEQYFYNDFAPLTYVEKPVDIPDFSMQRLKTSRGFTQEQISSVYEVINPLYKKCRETNYLDRNIHLERVLLALHRDFHNGFNLDSIKVNLWRLKTLFDVDFIAERHDAFVAFTDNWNGHRFTSEEVDEVRKKLTNLINSLDANASYAALKFNEKGYPLFEKHDEVEASSGQSLVTARRGMLQEQSPAVDSILKMNKDDGIPFRTNETAFWTNRVNEGLSSNKVSSKIISHMVCGEHSGLGLFWNDKAPAKVVFPNFLSSLQEVDCDYQTDLMPRKDFLPRTDYLYNPANNQVEFFNTNEVMHKIYKYKDKETIGLLSVLTDSSLSLVWPNLESFKTHWNQNLQPQFLRFLLKARKEYYETLTSYFDLFHDGEKACWFESDEEVCASKFYDLSVPITEEELEDRLKNKRSGRAYYAQVYTGDSFVEEVRTYALLAEKVFGEHAEISQELAGLVPKLHKTVKYLDTQDRSFNFQLEGMEEATVRERMEALPFPEILGEEEVEAFVGAYTEVRRLVTARKASLGDQQEPSDDELSALSDEKAKAYLAFKIYDNLEKSLDHLFNVVLKEYIGGASITYSNGE